jgi:dTMP kinase
VKEKLAGKFIVLDGPDGCGKTTQVKLLDEWLREQGVKTLALRDPGATAIGEKIRQILLNPEHIAMSVQTELLLYMAARAQLWEEKIAPALEEGKCVILDRWISSTCAYQGYAGGFGIDKVINVAESCLERVWPNLTVILDADVQTAAKRLDRDLDRMEQKGQEYHKKVQQGFLQLAKHYSNIVIVDGTEEIEKVHRRVIKALQETL